MARYSLLVTALLLVAALPGSVAQGTSKIYAGGAGYALYFDAQAGTDIATAIWNFDTTGTDINLSEFTVEFWLRIIDQYQPAQVPFSYGVYDASVMPAYDAPSELAFVVDQEGFQVQVQRHRNSWYCQVEQCTAGLGALNEWAHIALSYSSEKTYIELYRNGKLLHQNPIYGRGGQPLLNRGQLSLGQIQEAFGGAYDNSKAFSGLVDEFRVWDYVRTAPEIGAQFERRVDPASPGLVLMYTFDEPEGLPFNISEWAGIDYVKDHAGAGRPDTTLTLGRTQFLKNEMTFTDDRPSTSPTKPRFVMNHIPNLYTDGPEVVPIDERLYPERVPLKAWVVTGVDGGGSPATVIKLLTLPAHGVLQTITDQGTRGAYVSAGDIITSNYCPQSNCPRGLFFTPTPVDFLEAGGDSFQFVAIDEEESDPATVYLTPRPVIQPHDMVFTTTEDKMVVVVLGGVTHDGQKTGTMISSLPEKGTLYNVAFKEGGDFYPNIVDDLEELVPIEQVPFQVYNDRGVVFYQPPPQESGFGLATFDFTWFSNGLYSDSATASVDVIPINDPPISSLEKAQELICDKYYPTQDPGCYIAAESGSYLSVKLNSTDSDPPGVPSGAERPYFHISTFPVMGTLYQQEDAAGTPGEAMLPRPVLTASGYALAVANGTSQRSLCNDRTRCYLPWVCNTFGTRCEFTDYHLDNLVGPMPEEPRRISVEDSTEIKLPDFAHFRFADMEEKQFIEVQLTPEDAASPIYLNHLVVHETSAPGSIYRILSTNNYTGHSTHWNQIWGGQASARGFHADSEREWSPAVCPIPHSATHLRVEVDTMTHLDAYESFGAIEFAGAIGMAQGMVGYELSSANGTLLDYGRVLYKPRPGLHARSGVFDQFMYRSSDCEKESPVEVPISVTVSGPRQQASFCPSGDPADCQWVPYAASFGYFNPEPYVVYVQPDIEFRIDLPVHEMVSDMFQLKGLYRTRDWCNTYGDLSVALQGTMHAADAVFYGYAGGRGVADLPILNTQTPLTVDGQPSAEVAALLGSCPDNIKQPPVYPIAVHTPRVPGRAPIALDWWVTMQPGMSAADPLYIYRLRHELRAMCSYNQTHVHYAGEAGAADGYGVVAPRLSFNASGGCDDCLCNPDLECFETITPEWSDDSGVCTPCHQLSAAQVDAIMASPQPGVAEFFQEVCWNQFKKCRKGQFLDLPGFQSTGLVQCQECPAGSYMPVKSREAECIPCPVGFAMGKTGQSECVRCVYNSYADSEGSTECTSCPREKEADGRPRAFTVELNTTDPYAGRAIGDCVCRPGYWSPLRLNGQVCDKCPTGAFCIGGRSAPVPCGQAVFNSESITAYTDSWRWQCTITDGGHWGDPEFPSEFWMCQHDWCRGGPEHTCRAGHKGRMCEECEEGYHAVGAASCLRCPGGKNSSDSWWYTFGMVVLTAWVWVMLCGMVNLEYESVNIAILYVQIISVVQKFQLNWPNRMFFRVLHNIFSLINFDVAFLDVACIMSWDYVDMFYLQLCTPLLAGFFALVPALWGLYCNKYMVAYTREEVYKMPLARQLMHKYIITFYTDQQLQNCYDLTVQIFLQFIILNYNILTQTVLQVFECTPMPNGSKYLTAYPPVTCWKGQHYDMVAVAMVGLVLYVIGTPLFLFSILQWGKAKDVLNTDRFYRTFSWLYARYEHDSSWWELVLILRRFLIVACLAFCRQQPYLQAFLGILVMVVAAIAQLHQNPYVVDKVDVLEAVALVSTIIYIVVGLMYYSRPRFVDMEVEVFFEREASLEFWLGFLIFVSLAWCLYNIWDEIQEQIDRKVARKIINKRVLEAMEGVGLAYQLLGNNADEVFAMADKDGSGELDLEEFSARLKAVDPDFEDVAIENAFREIDADGSGTIDVHEFRAHLWKSRNTLAMHEEDGGAWARAGQLASAVAAWFKRCLGLESESDVAHRQMMAKMRRAVVMRIESQTEQMNVSIVGSLADSMPGSAVRSFAERTLADKSMIRFHQADQWLSKMLHNNSKVSQHAQNDLVNFFRPLTETFPFVIDWLTTASEADKVAFCRVCDSLIECKKSVGSHGLYSSTVVEAKRPAVAIWLKDSTEEQQMVFWEVMHAVAAVCREPEDVKKLMPYEVEEEVVNEGDDDEDEDEKVGAAAKGRDGAEPKKQDGRESDLTFIDEELAAQSFGEDDDDKLDASKALGPSAKGVEIVGNASVGSVLVTGYRGDMPEGTTRCRVRWFRVSPVRGSAVGHTQKITGEHNTQYRVSPQDLGCKLRAIVQPIGADGAPVGEVSSAVSDVVTEGSARPAEPGVEL